MIPIVTKKYLGSRGDNFKKLITDLLKRGNLKPDCIDFLVNEAGMKEYGIAFTASSADPVNNYERFEQIGDVTANKFIVWYAYKRFPQLDCTAGVGVVARIRINYGAKATFALIAEKLGFWDYISAEEDGNERNKKYRNRHKKELLEDTFEAFIGATEYLLDKQYQIGIGYRIVYDILADIFDELSISLRFEDLFDPKTRLKETFDAFQQLGTWVYIDSREILGEDGHTIARSVLYQAPVGTSNKPVIRKAGLNNKDQEFPQSGWIPIGDGTASTKGDAQQKAASKGIQKLKSMGYYREPPIGYSNFCN